VTIRERKDSAAIAAEAEIEAAEVERVAEMKAAEVKKDSSDSRHFNSIIFFLLVINDTSWRSEASHLFTQELYA
jgi:hypothetical protein